MRVFGITGTKNAGKTTLTSRLVSHFRAAGLSVSTIKHGHHEADVDTAGRDSHRHRLAGAQEVILATPKRWALMHELGDAPEPGLAELLGKLAPVDLVLVEGFKSEDHPKIEVHRAANGRPLLWPHYPAICAIATDAALSGLALPQLPLDDIEAIAGLVLEKARG